MGIVHIAQRTIFLRCEIMSKMNLLVICRNDTYGWGWGSIEINIWGRKKKSNCMRLNFVNVKKNVMHNDITVMNTVQVVVSQIPVMIATKGRQSKIEEVERFRECRFVDSQEKTSHMFPVIFKESS